MTTEVAIAQTLESIVGEGAVQSWDAIAQPLRSHLALAVTPNAEKVYVVYPNTPAELAEVVTCAAKNRWNVLPCGRGSKLHWGGLTSGIQIAISTARLNRLVEHAVGDLTVTVEAGMPFAELQAILSNAGQFLAIDPTHPEQATLGGIVATADTGALRQRYGGVRDMLIGLSFVRSDGQVANAGGRVVKNVAGYDLMKLLTGSYGTLGLLSQVTFRIYPLPEASRTVVLTGAAEAIAQASQTLLASALTPTAVELISPTLLKSLSLQGAMGLLVRFQGIAVGVEQQTAQLLQVGQTLGLEGSLLADIEEANLWQQLQEQMQATTPEADLTCKIGVLPSQAILLLDKINQISAPSGFGLIHAASGLGVWRCSSQQVQPATLMAIRSLCQAHSGFLTILEAPIALKQQLEVWGYAGNALGLMQQIKQQFDPLNLLSPQRFVGGI